MKRMHRSRAGARAISLSALLLSAALVLSCQPALLMIDSGSDGKWSGNILAFHLEWSLADGYAVRDFVVDPSWYRDETPLWHPPGRAVLKGPSFTLVATVPAEEEGGGKEITITGKFIGYTKCVGTVSYDGAEATWTAVGGSYYAY